MTKLRDIPFRLFDCGDELSRFLRENHYGSPAALNGETGRYDVLETELFGGKQSLGIGFALGHIDGDDQWPLAPNLHFDKYGRLCTLEIDNGSYTYVPTEWTVRDVWFKCWTGWYDYRQRIWTDDELRDLEEGPHTPD